MKVRSDREGPTPRVHLNSIRQVIPTQRRQQQEQHQAKSTSRETTQSVAERTRVRPADAEAEGAPPVQRTRTAVSVPVTATIKTTSQTTGTSPARAVVERVGNEAGEDSQLVQMRRIAAFMAECEGTNTSKALAEARRIYLEKLTKVKDAVIKVVPRTDATTRPLTGRCLDTMHHDGARRARWTTRGYEQTLSGNEDFFSTVGVACTSK